MLDENVIAAFSSMEILLKEPPISQIWETIIINLFEHKYKFNNTTELGLSYVRPIAMYIKLYEDLTHDSKFMFAAIGALWPAHA